MPHMGEHELLHRAINMLRSVNVIALSKVLTLQDFHFSRQVIIDTTIPEHSVLKLILTALHRAVPGSLGARNVHLVDTSLM